MAPRVAAAPKVLDRMPLSPNRIFQPSLTLNFDQTSIREGVGEVWPFSGIFPSQIDHWSFASIFTRLLQKYFGKNSYIRVFGETRGGLYTSHISL
jgi:hypothetical protein